MCYVCLQCDIDVIQVIHTISKKITTNFQKNLSKSKLLMREMRGNSGYVLQL